MEDEIKKLETKAAKLRKLKEKFPDLIEDRDRWGRVRLKAKSANAQTTHITTHHSCGCCNDAPFLARPYLKYEGEDVYSDPASICIGEKSTSYYGEVWDDDWREKLAKVGIPLETISILEKDFARDQKRAGAYDDYQEALSDLDEV